MPVAHRDAGYRIVASREDRARKATMMALLDAHAHVREHHTLARAAWLNRDEFWFAKVKRARLNRRIFCRRASLPP